MDTADAFQIVLDLAKQNLINKWEYTDEHARQCEAIDIVEDVAVNEFGDD
jgi:hypothetical protein